jgi:transposase
MEQAGPKGVLFTEKVGGQGGRIQVNARVRIETHDRYRVVSIAGVVLAHYAVGDRMGEAHAMIALVDQGWAKQTEVAKAFGCSERTVRRHERRFAEGGLAALGRASGYPRGRARKPRKDTQRANDWKSHGVPNREIARRLGVSEKAVRKLLRRLGWVPQLVEQLELPVLDADPNLSGSAAEPSADGPSSAAKLQQEAEPEVPPGADPNLSGSEDAQGDLAPTPVSFDTDAGNRQIDRLLACMGLLDDAAPVFRTGRATPGAGVLLAVPALVESGVLDIARELYGSIGPAFYGLRTTIVTLLLMALWRIKRPEGLKERNPEQLGRLLGLDRAPEIKTLRRKLTRLAEVGRAVDFGRELARRRVTTRGHAMGFLYVDGHVRVYHGKRTLPKAHVARMRLTLPATTDYWVNDAEGEPLFVVTADANQGLTKMLPTVLAQVRALVGDRRVTVVFDRGGWSPKLFKNILASDFDILTYRKKPFRRVFRRRFAKHEAVIDGTKLAYELADQNVLLLGRKLRLRQVTRLSDNGHQTHIITSRRDLSAIEVAYRMFERWRQENFFKYLREEFALDALVDYGVEPADPTRSVPNPERTRIATEIRKAYFEVNQLVAQYGVAALGNVESVRSTMRGFKIANAPMSKRIFDRMKNIVRLEAKRSKIPTRVPVQKLVDGDIVKLGVERKHLTDLLKMVAYQAESDLVRLIAPHYQRAEDEGRTLVHSALATAGDIELAGDEIRVALAPLSSPHRTAALAALCNQLNETRTRFPGTTLRLRFELLPEPQPSLAFPGARPAKPPAEAPQPDISGRG